MQRKTQVPLGKHINRQHASPHHEVATDVKQMPIRPIIKLYKAYNFRFSNIKVSFITPTVCNDASRVAWVSDKTPYYKISHNPEAVRVAV